MSTQKKLKKFGSAILLATTWSLLSTTALADAEVCGDQSVSEIPQNLKIDFDLTKLPKAIVIMKSDPNAFVGEKGSVTCWVNVDKDHKNNRRIVPRVLRSEKNIGVSKDTGRSYIEFYVKDDKTVRSFECSSERKMTLRELNAALSPIATLPLKFKSKAECDKVIDASFQQSKASLDKALAELGSKSGGEKSAQAERETKTLADDRLAEREAHGSAVSGRAL